MISSDERGDNGDDCCEEPEDSVLSSVKASGTLKTQKNLIKNKVYRNMHALKIVYGKLYLKKKEIKNNRFF